jgi:hypothetical protein
MNQVSETPIYLVQGSTGCYEDYHEWIAGAFFSKAKAESFQKECKEYCKDYMKMVPDPEDGELVEQCFLCEFINNSPDKLFDCDYNGTTYRIKEILVQGD